MDKAKYKKMYELADKLSKVDAARLTEQQLAERDQMIQRLQEFAQGVAEVRSNIDADQAGFYVVDDDGNAVSGPFASKQEAYERAAEMAPGRNRGMYDVKYKGDIIPLDSLISKIIKTLPPDVTSDDLQDPMDLEQQLETLRSPLLKVFSKLSPYEQAEVTDEVANHFYDRRFGGFAERKQKGVAEGVADEKDIINSGMPLKYIEQQLQQSGLEKDIRYFIRWAIDNGSSYIEDAIKLGDKAQSQNPEISYGLNRLKKYVGQGVAEGRHYPSPYDYDSDIDYYAAVDRYLGKKGPRPGDEDWEETAPGDGFGDEDDEKTNEADAPRPTYNVMKLGGALDIDPRMLRVAITRGLQGQATRTDMSVLARSFLNMISNSDDKDIQYIANLIKTGNPKPTPQESTAAIAERNAFVNAMRNVKQGEKFSVGGKEYTKTTKHGEDSEVTENINKEAYDRLKRVFDFSNFKGDV